METWQVIFRNLYTGFLLRDFAGKVVPGVLLLFSITAMFRSPKQLIQDLRKDVPIFTILFVAGFAWIVTLGTQSLAEGLGIWKYFPISRTAPVTPGVRVGFWSNLSFGGDETSFDESTARVDLFQLDATEDQKQQYERFVVIKEACGNLFISGLLSLPAWMVVLFNRSKSSDHISEGHGSVKKVGSARAPHEWSKQLKYVGAPIMGSVYFLLVMTGLHRMNAQHVRRQLRYAEIVAGNRKDRVQKPIVAPPPKPAGTNPP